MIAARELEALPDELCELLDYWRAEGLTPAEAAAAFGAPVAAGTWSGVAALAYAVWLEIQAATEADRRALDRVDAEERALAHKVENEVCIINGGI